MAKPYVPIDCGFHDELLSRATLGQRSKIVYREDETEHTTNDYIEDVYTRGEEEFARLRSGLVLRLDQIVRVDSSTP